MDVYRGTGLLGVRVGEHRRLRLSVAAHSPELAWIGQHLGAADGRRGLPVDLRARLRWPALGDPVEHLLEAFAIEVFVGITPDQHHRRIDAGAEALDLLPRKIAVGRDLERLLVDPPAADLE